MFITNYKEFTWEELSLSKFKRIKIKVSLSKEIANLERKKLDSYNVREVVTSKTMSMFVLKRFKGHIQDT